LKYSQDFIDKGNRYLYGKVRYLGCPGTLHALLYHVCLYQEALGARGGQKLIPPYDLCTQQGVSK